MSKRDLFSSSTSSLPKSATTGHRPSVISMVSGWRLESTRSATRSSPKAAQAERRYLNLPPRQLAHTTNACKGVKGLPISMQPQVCLGKHALGTELL
eukprot:CAMPEP_0178372888 /NCGR_PEP_ID=MMETSP0689_2-20121128/1585_1 /TAXON_ID=160604 /ORGANISM="Amphidinium massartii, Strain CS-259" /LENGTH=96 /DNA_ID=CAMNT_0019992825 /DNA_START=421 /DNA_END=711 /DNA_ORIENTATION=+